MDHIPVLLKETIESLDPKPNENFIDCTFGRGGHTRALLERTAPNGILIGLDWDAQSLEDFKDKNSKEYDSRLILENLNFADIERAEAIKRVQKIDGILFDLGMSSWHIDDSAKGFSFSKNEPLDMRYSRDNPVTAANLVNTATAAELEKIFNDYGEEKAARKIAAAIVKARSQKKIETTSQLAAIIARIAGPVQKTQSLARVFQALRVAVNREFKNIENGLEGGLRLLHPGGRLAVISFHSLEDRIVKNKFRGWEKEGLVKLLNDKPIIPSVEEVEQNSRSRSSKLRAVIKL